MATRPVVPTAGWQGSWPGRGRWGEQLAGGLTDELGESTVLDAVVSLQLPVNPGQHGSPVAERGEQGNAPTLLPLAAGHVLAARVGRRPAVEDVDQVQVGRRGGARRNHGEARRRRPGDGRLRRLQDRVRDGRLRRRRRPRTTMSSGPDAMAAWANAHGSSTRRMVVVFGASLHATSASVEAARSTGARRTRKGAHIMGPANDKSPAMMIRSPAPAKTGASFRRRKGMTFRTEQATSAAIPVLADGITDPKAANAAGR